MPPRHDVTAKLRESHQLKHNLGSGLSASVDDFACGNAIPEPCGSPVL